MDEKRVKPRSPEAVSVRRAGARCARLAVGIAVLASVAGAAGAAQAAPLAEGDKVTNFVAIGGKQIALPRGEWTVAGLGTQTLAATGIGAYGAIQSAVLFLVKDSHVAALLEVNTNAIAVRDGWGRTTACKPDGQLLLTTSYATGWETSCVYVVATRIGPDAAGPAAWQRAKAFADTAKLTMASIWLTAGYRMSDRQDIVDLRYHFDPAFALGATAAAIDQASGWTAAAIGADPLRQAAVDVVSSWATGFDDWIERGLHNQIAGETGLLPGAAAYAGEAPHADAKLIALEGLYRGRRIGWDDYAAQSAEAPAEPPVLKRSLLPATLEKNISFRIFGTIVDYGIAYSVTANPAVSTGIALTIAITDSGWFVGNDVFWDDHYAKLSDHDSERLVDFVYVGEKVQG